MWHVSVAGTFKLEVTHGCDLEEHKYRKGAGPSFADMSTPEAEQTDAGAAIPRAFSFLSSTFV